MIPLARLAAAALLLLLVGAAWTWRVVPASEPAPSNRPVVTPATSMPLLAEAGTSTSLAPETTEAATSGDDPVEAAREALRAWGRFAVSGDLSQVEGWFHRDGPQYRRLEAEAGSIRQDPPGDPPYVVTLELVELVEHVEGVSVRARVVFIRTGEPSQSFDWDIHLRQSTGRWQVWTVDG